MLHCLCLYNVGIPYMCIKLFKDAALPQNFNPMKSNENVRIIILTNDYWRLGLKGICENKIVEGWKTETCKIYISLYIV